MHSNSQMERVQQMANALRERSSAAQAQLRDSSFFLSKRAASVVSAVAWGVAGVGAVAALAVGAGPVLTVAGVAVAAGVGGAGAALAATAKRREEQREQADIFLKAAKGIYAELHNAYGEIRAEQHAQQSSGFNPSVDYVNYQSQRTQMTNSSSLGARSDSAPSTTVRNSSGPRL